jgi:predicted lipoprotein with Yx(FWY)xxD motif
MNWRMPTKAGGIAIVAMALLGGLWAPASTLGRPGEASTQTLVKVAFNKKLKHRILVTATGRTLYLWSDDPRGKPTCYDDETYHCSRGWIPLRATSTPVAGKGVKASLLTTVNRTDGDPQVMYNGHPLYTDAGLSIIGLTPDKKRGDVNGEGLYGWYAVSPSGKPVK